ncbi:haloacid dehalogenase type II [Cellulosimicrobium protaetiae]|uniref:Haloacid dehalogenase type II n=1 Tax=Cellulosimicrobium protaetiae TaxID=2587808 RepID=A0A6M5UE19_9MICO|nr:haloacid dehalogenase type II [Cellulosimicrobium protaetiae]QJW36746.1 haloacid dehalogenase type II [Cellulosimicrobium protaetiae]
MRPTLDVEVVVIDVLGTLVDQPRGLRTALHDVLPDASEESVRALARGWEEHVETQQLLVAARRRDYVDSDVLDAEAARQVATSAGITDADAVAHLATYAQRLPAWEDTVHGLDLLAGRFPVVALSNASSASLLRLDAHAGLRWHHTASSESVGAYKPDPAIYRHALAVARCEPDRALMVAAHAWDLRGARDVGMSTAYVDRPVGDPPTTDDDFDLAVGGLVELAVALGAPR